MGFGPFGRCADNPSGTLALECAERRGVHGASLPVAYARAAAEFDRLCADVRPGAILGLGVHSGPAFRLESRAGPPTSVEADIDGERADALGLGAGPDRRSALALAPFCDALRKVGVDVEISEDPGGYLCEFIYHRALGVAEARGIPALFLHVPPLEEAPLDAQRRAVRAAVRAMEDARDAGGS